ncbi:hypothetical protein ACQZV8_14900 [Magnetococcales bacterium HHB-1]
MKRFSNIKSLSFWKGLILFYLIFLVIFFAATPLLTFFLYWETDLTTSILPELIGFCLQGGFLVLIFSLYEQRSVNQARAARKFALQSYLFATLDDAIQPRKEQDLTSPLHPPETLDEKIEQIKQQGLSEESKERFENLAKRELIPLSSLSAVAAQIDQKHMTVWMDIITATREIEPGEKRLEHATQLLRHIERFDDLPL